MEQSPGSDRREEEDEEPNPTRAWMQSSRLIELLHQSAATGHSENWQIAMTLHRRVQSSNIIIFPVKHKGLKTLVNLRISHKLETLSTPSQQ